MAVWANPFAFSIIYKKKEINVPLRKTKSHLKMLHDQRVFNYSSYFILKKYKPLDFQI
jgi:hypothetical protein